MASPLPPSTIVSSASGATSKWSVSVAAACRHALKPCAHNVRGPESTPRAYMNLLEVDLKRGRRRARIHHEHRHSARLALGIAVGVAQARLLASQLIALAAVGLRVANGVERCVAVGAAPSVSKRRSVIVDRCIPVLHKFATNRTTKPTAHSWLYLVSSAGVIVLGACCKQLPDMGVDSRVQARHKRVPSPDLSGL